MSSNLVNNQGFGSDLCLGKILSLRQASYKRFDTTYEDNHYLELLNKTLKHELQIVEVCRANIKSSTLEKYRDRIVDQHKQACQALIDLITAHGGIPEDLSMITCDFTRMVINISSVMPEWISHQANYATFVMFEKNLFKNYDCLLKLAPPQDIALLTRLHDMICCHLSLLDSID